MQDAKEILEFNKFMRKRLMEFYRLTKCPVPHSSMLFKRRKAFSIRISPQSKVGTSDVSLENDYSAEHQSISIISYIM